MDDDVVVRTALLVLVGWMSMPMPGLDVDVDVDVDCVSVMMLLPSFLTVSVGNDYPIIVPVVW
jgi:hypothetical protein